MKCKCNDCKSEFQSTIYEIEADVGNRVIPLFVHDTGECPHCQSDDITTEEDVELE